MLITNFASGELSETLFGRIDLPQYYQGASRIENFDIMPTGGINRRPGTRRLVTLPAEGRIIPFIVDRERHYLLFLMPGKIQVYLEGALVSEVTGTANIPLYPDMGVIHEVQYAQNAGMMVLTHKSRNPVIAELLEDGTISVSLFEIDIEVKAVMSDDSLSTDIEADKTYEENRYLQEERSYPSCVNFFQGRLVFAGTEKNPQRLFFSSSDNIYKFSTYKKFVTEQKTYVSVSGKIVNGSDKFELTNAFETLRFQEGLSDYICDSPLFPAGTKIVSLISTTLTLTDKAYVPEAITPEEQAALELWRAKVQTNDDNPYPYDMGECYKGSYLLPRFRIHIGSTYIRIEQYDDDENNYYFDIKIPEDKAWYFYESRNPPNNPAVAIFFVQEFIISELDRMAREKWGSGASASIVRSSNWGAYLVNIANTMVERIGIAFEYSFRGFEYHGSAAAIYQQITGKYIGDGSNVYLAFYIPELIIDRHPTPDDGFTFEIASDMSDSIRWIGQNKNLLVGTETAEWVIPAGVNATSTQAVLNSRYGSDKIQGTAVGDAMCFIQSGKRALVEYYIPQQDNNFRANNMAMLSGNMLHESPAHDIDFISAPYTKIFVSREDGVIAALLYERNTGTFAWGRITTNGMIKSVATLPGRSGYDNVYLAVKRGDGFFLEILAGQDYGETDPAKPDYPVYLDSGKPWDGDASGYTADAAVYDETDNKVYPLTQAPIPGHRMWAGYPYTSMIRSMPVLANDRMKPNIIKNMYIRFLDSFMPRIRSLPNGMEDRVYQEEPYSGIAQINFPGAYARDVLFEIIHKAPTRCRILSINAEAN